MQRGWVTLLVWIALGCGSGDPPPAPAGPVNALGAAASPYLRRHAADPVAWAEWDDAALARARTEDRPIFLSIGYLACHWCAVMHEESFVDPEIAALLNERFVSIKVDREERPDVDAAWLPVVQGWTGSAGWPFTIILAPDLTPLFAASYLPPRDGERGFPRGFGTVLRETSNTWAGDRSLALARGTALAAEIRRSRGLGGAAGVPPPPSVCDAQLGAILAARDGVHGGFGRGAKFPQVAALARLVEHAAEPTARAVLVQTLDAMAAGGLRDPLRGGFFRYTTDPAWKKPHFEKMLVDQAALARLYLVAAAEIPERAEAWRAIALETLEFALRELRLPRGGFGTGLDARSDGREGATYLWTADALRSFGVDPAAWGVTAEPGLPIRAGGEVPARWRAAALARPSPELDDKRVSGWNGMMVSALAIGGFALNRPSLLDEARSLAEILVAGDLPLPRTPAGSPGMLEDQALVGLGLLDLHAATGEPRWLVQAEAVAAAARRTYAADGGGWVRTGPAGFRPWGPERPVDDGPEPSGTAAMAELELRIAALRGTDPKATRLAFERVADALREGTFFRSSLCGSFELLSRPPLEVVLAIPPGGDATAMRDAAATGIGRGWVLVHAPDADVPIAADKTPIDGQVTAYVCRGGVCELPTTDPEALRARL